MWEDPHQNTKVCVHHHVNTTNTRQAQTGRSLSSTVHVQTPTSANLRVPKHRIIFCVFNTHMAVLHSPRFHRRPLPSASGPCKNQSWRVLPPGCHGMGMGSAGQQPVPSPRSDRHHAPANCEGRTLCVFLQSFSSGDSRAGNQLIDTYW